MVALPDARSSTHCELVALGLLHSVDAAWGLSDSLCALKLIAGWGSYPLKKVLRCPDREDVRHYVEQWNGSLSPPTLQKVAAHDEQGLRDRLPWALGNDAADKAANAARGCGQRDDRPVFSAAADAVLLMTDMGDKVMQPQV